jgi:hypothetical protein
MKCEDAERLIIDYLDRTLDDKTVGELERHIASCERCLSEVHETQNVLVTIASAGDEEPDEMLQLNFFHMLHNEVVKQQKNIPVPETESRKVKSLKRIYAIAAGLALLITGSLIGIIISKSLTGPKQAEEISKLRSEVDELRKTAMFSMLKEQSSSSRIEAVSYSEAIDTPDENMIEALTATLNNDRNVNVRLTAAYALSKYGNLKKVRDSLVTSLSLQKDPIVQVTLINILVDLREKSALKQIEKIISNEKTMTEVRSVAEKGAKLLL